MACRIGITTDPEARKAYWREQYPISRWKILGTFLTKEKAQQAEKDLADKLGCEAHPGGPDKDGPWHLYRIDY